jgi:hypothetical protein
LNGHEGGAPWRRAVFRGFFFHKKRSYDRQNDEDVYFRDVVVFFGRLDRPSARRTGGCSGFASVSVMEKAMLEVEFLGTADEFAAGELDASVNACQPKTFNVELAFQATEEMEIAARYGGSDDCGDLLPEKLIGLDISYDIFDRTTLSAEIQRGEFENEDVTTTVTGQLAIGF